MSNYRDPTATKAVDLGDCRCPGGPHKRDSATVRTQFGYGAKGQVREATRRQGAEAGHLVAILRGTVSWTLVLPDGSPRPLDSVQVGLLDEPTVQTLLEAIDEAWAEEPLPNESSALSPDGSSESAFPTPTQPTTTETSPISTTS